MKEASYSTGPYATNEPESMSAEEMNELIEGFIKDHPPVASDLFCGSRMLQAIKDGSEITEQQQDLCSSFRMHVVEDYPERLRKALGLSMATGKPVLCENEEGQIVVFSMEKQDTDLFPINFSPASFMREFK